MKEKMNEKLQEILIELGFEDFLDHVQGGRCPFCEKKVSEREFRDGVSVSEYNISGMCQQCQDNTFNS